MTQGASIIFDNPITGSAGSSSTTAHETENRSNFHQSKAQESAQCTAEPSKQYKHSTDEGISDKQLKLIVNLVGTYDEAEQATKRHLQKSLSALNSAEANEMIQSLKKKKGLGVVGLVKLIC